MGSYTLGENADRLMGDSIISVLLPHVQQFRQATRIFQVDTRLAVTENNPDRVVDDIKVILGFARQQKNESYLVCNLVGVALFKIGVAQIEEVIRENPKFLNQGQLTQLQNAVAKFDFSKIDFSGERAGQRDLLQRVYSDDGSGDGRLTPEGLEILTMLQQWQAAGDNTKDSAGIPWQRQSRLTRSVFGPALMISQPRRQEVANSIEDLIEEAETRSSTPWWEDNLSDLSAETEITSVALLSKALSRIHSSFQVTIAAQDAGLLGMAIERYRLKFDSWPQSMEELKDEFLDRVPLDRVTGEPLIFKASDDGVIVYSVGGDLDDDGGNHNAKAIPLYSTYDDTADGDWVLWPIDRG